MTHIEEIKDAIVKHYQDNPTHGVGCACLDEYVRQARSAMRVSDYWYHEEEPLIAKGMAGVELVFHRAAHSVHKYQKSKRSPLPLHRTEATIGFTCSTCDGGGCPDCTDPA